MDGVCGGFADGCDVSGSLLRVTTTYDCSAGTCLSNMSMMSVACSRPTEGLSCSDGSFCNGTDTCAGGACSLHTGSPCGPETCDEAGDRCFSCGARGEPCCPGRLVDNTATDVCCGPDPGTVQQCCAHSDCPASYCPGAGSRWECVAGMCCYGPCDAVC
jgi:hypothetical protein